MPFSNQHTDKCTGFFFFLSREYLFLLSIRSFLWNDQKCDCLICIHCCWQIFMVWLVNDGIFSSQHMTCSVNLRWRRENEKQIFSWYFQLNTQFDLENSILDFDGNFLRIMIALGSHTNYEKRKHFDSMGDIVFLKSIKKENTTDLW